MLKLHDYQEQHIASAIQSKTKRWLFNNEMGLGKSCEAIESCKKLNASNILIVCPAIVRYNWLKELDKWWNNHPKIGLITAGLSRGGLSKKESARLALAYESSIKIISYNLLKEIENIKGLDAIIFDECHRLSHPDTEWSIIARKIVNEHKNAHIFGLTATIMPNKPLDSVGICECLWPGRFGGISIKNDLSFKTKTRYSNAEHNGHGWVYKGINELYISELQERLKQTSSRTTKKDIPHLIPPFDLKHIQLQHKTKNITFSDARNYEEVLKEFSNIKQNYILDWIQDTKENCTHIAILTYLKDTARTLAEAIKNKNKSTPVHCITGELTPEKRNELLRRAKNERQSIIVATMHSIGIGIDLTFCTNALFAELYYKPETLIQALGRFSRLSSKDPSTCYILSIKNTIDEKIATALLDKIQTINQLVDAGLSESDLVKALDTEIDFIQQANEILQSANFDEYS